MERNSKQFLPETLFENELILNKIQKFLALNETQNLRSTNKLWNFVASKLLHRRTNSVKKIDDIKGLTRFLDTMENRLENIPIYSAFKLVMAKMSFAEIDRFITDFEDWVKVLNLELVNETEDKLDSNSMENYKFELFRILKNFPNIVELSLEYNEDWKLKYLKFSDTTTLPRLFPHLKFLQFKYVRKVSPHRTACNDRPASYPSAINCFNTILSRAPNLVRIQFERYDAYITPSLKSIADNLCEFPNSPALSITTQLYLEDDQVDDLLFLQKCIEISYRNLRVLNIFSVVDPTPETITIFNKFLNLQASSLESFTFSIYAMPEHGKNVLKIPPMSNLIFLEINMNHWHLRRIHPRLTLKNFPKLDELQVQVKQNFWDQELVSKKVKVYGGNYSSASK